MSKKLEGLKEKWFLNLSKPEEEPFLEPFKYKGRHKGSKIKSHTDNNYIEFFIDGATYMDALRSDIIKFAKKGNTAIFHAGWKTTNVDILPDKNIKLPPKRFVDLIKWAVNNHKLKFYGLLTSLAPNSSPIKGFNFNRATLIDLVKSKKGSPVFLDRRYPNLGSNHQKINVINDQVSYSGSIDVNEDRWDTSKHEKKYPFPTHDTGHKVIGEAANDVLCTFTERWNDDFVTKSRGMHWPGLLQFSERQKFTAFYKKIEKEKVIKNKSLVRIRNNHPCSIQVLHTYGIQTKIDDHFYTWSSKKAGGEFTIWAAYLKAIHHAKKYIYIEDQYFLAFGSPPNHSCKNDKAILKTDIIYQLGEAINRGVKIAVLYPNNALEPGGSVERVLKNQRHLAFNYLLDKASKSKNGDFLAVYPVNFKTERDIYVHSKLMIVDDEFILHGSANINRRSMTCDDEIQLAILDESGYHGKDLRKKIFKKFAGINESDPILAYEELKKNALNHFFTAIILNSVTSKHLRGYKLKKNLNRNDKSSIGLIKYNPTQNIPRGKEYKVRLNLYDPYRGPQHLKECIQPKMV